MGLAAPAAFCKDLENTFIMPLLYRLPVTAKVRPIKLKTESCDEKKKAEHTHRSIRRPSLNKLKKAN